MIGMKAEEAGRFYEEDEDPDEVFAAFDAAVKGRTAPPGGEHPAPRWPEKIRHQLAVALRHVANLIESRPDGVR
jgi:hypothetical protein